VDLLAAPVFGLVEAPAGELLEQLAHQCSSW
jgi:hypothetical protein